MSRVAVFNQKGGVGKTTTALNLGAALNRSQAKTLLIDMDPQCHLTEVNEALNASSGKSLFDFYQSNTPLSELIVAWENVSDIIPSHKQLIKVDSSYGRGPAILNKLNHGLTALEKEFNYDNIVMDCCPYVGVLSLNAIFAADLVIIPISSDFLSLKSALKVEKSLAALETVLKKRVERRYVLTSFDQRRKMSFEVLKQANTLFGQDLCKTVINSNVALAESVYYQKDIFNYQPKSQGAEDYYTLTSELLKDLLINIK
ncbi:MAG: ParA family protein [Methylophilaceae bacterium]